MISNLPGIAMGVVFDLNHRADILEWHFIKVSVANVVVIVAMLIVFALAIALPFPGAAERASARRSEGSS